MRSVAPCGYAVRKRRPEADLYVVKVKSLSHVQLCATPWTVMGKDKVPLSDTYHAICGMHFLTDIGLYSSRKFRIKS